MGWREQILSFLEGQDDVRERDLLEGIAPDCDRDFRSPPPTEASARWAEIGSELDRLVRDGIVGRSYVFDEVIPGMDCIGRVYFVWLKTPETANRDADREAVDLEHALLTGGRFSHDPQLLRDLGLR